MSSNPLQPTLDTVFAGRDPVTGWLWQPLLGLLARGAPVSVADLAAATRRSDGDVAAALERLRDIEYDPDGRVVGFGITLRPTPHRFVVDGRLLHTWCALDTLIFPAILDRPAQVESACQTTGTPVRITIEPDQLVDVDPREAVVSIVPCGKPTSVRSCFCDHVHFFATAGAAQPWLDAHPDGTVLSVADAHELGRGLAAALSSDARSHHR